MFGDEIQAAIEATRRNLAPGENLCDACGGAGAPGGQRCPYCFGSGVEQPDDVDRALDLKFMASEVGAPAMGPIASDCETHTVQPGRLAPPLVCGSFASQAEGTEEIVDALAWLDRMVPATVCADLIIGANFAYDFGVVANERPDLLPAIFQAYEEGRVYDVQIGQALDFIARGCMTSDGLIDPRTGGPVKNPDTGKIVDRFSLATCADLTLGFKGAKRSDFWRARYAILASIPIERWPEIARQYPKDDVRNTFDVALGQTGSIPRGPESIEPGSTPFRNLHNMIEQARAAWALHLASAWGLRTDGEAVARLEAKVEEAHAAAMQRFTGKFVRPADSKGKQSEDQAALKRAVAISYGASGTCPRCRGTGKVPSPKTKNQITCKVYTDGDGGRIGCDGTGLDLATAPALPRTETGGISTNRDTLSESGDEELEEYAHVSQTEKLRDTYLPFLKQGIHYPINLRANPLVATGRTSYDGLIQLIPRDGGVRECFVPRPGWVYCSIDWSALELCTLAQVTFSLLGKSTMREVINASGDPGMLHTQFAARMVGTTVEDLAARIAAGDPVAAGFRQAAKAADFGFPGLMGASTFVLAKRKRIEGFTPSPFGPILEEVDGKPTRGYAGLRFCILMGGEQRCGTVKVTEWRRKEIPPTCRKCLECAEDLRKLFLEQWPEMPEYFDWISWQIDNHGEIVQLKSERVRGNPTKSAAANTLFQGLAADGAKHALWRVSRECYVDRRSPMFGDRPVFFAHDEIFSELREATAHVSAPHMARVMNAAMQEYTPDVVTSCEPALMRRWSKKAKTVYDASGRLVPWEDLKKQKAAA